MLWGSFLLHSHKHTNTHSQLNWRLTAPIAGVLFFHEILRKPLPHHHRRHGCPLLSVPFQGKSFRRSSIEFSDFSVLGFREIERINRLGFPVRLGTWEALMASMIGSLGLIISSEVEPRSCGTE